MFLSVRIRKEKVSYNLSVVVYMYCKTLYKFWNSSKIFALTEVQCKSNEMSIMLATVIDPE